MKHTRLFATLVVAAALGGFGTAASAAEATQDDFMLLLKIENMDKDKDGMVSKKEFIDMVAKSWDMYVAGKKMTGDKMDVKQLRELEKLLGRTLGADALR